LENVIVQYVMKTLQRDKELMEKLGMSSFEVIGLENKFEMKIDGFNFVGYVDRMDSFLPGEVRIVDYKTGRVEADDVDINDGNAERVAEALFGDDNQKRPKIAFQLFLYDYLAASNPEFKGKVLVNSVYQPAKFFTEEVRNVPMSLKFNEEVEERLHGLLSEIRDPEAGWRRTDDTKTCSWCDFKMICGRQ
ncbi:MAG: PD-(D/E)XK nuclease family protein, partial [Bacteroidales bacterium]|nr:PD-(D/E)XK nuclease family protein [Bacteroidales bacterium]